MTKHDALAQYTAACVQFHAGQLSIQQLHLAYQAAVDCGATDEELRAAAQAAIRPMGKAVGR